MGSLEERQSSRGFAHINEVISILVKGKSMTPAQQKNLLQEVSAYCERSNLWGSMSNLSALLFYAEERLNWLGFYLLKGERLELGPFQGKPACTVIPVGRGVCGVAAQQKQSLLVKDVDQFSDHIVCDSDSRSELVVPLLKGHQLLGVLDIDSPELSRFSVTDQLFYEKVAQEIVKHLF